MDKLFLQLINMSITSSYVIFFIILVRLVLKRAPKVFSYGLWTIAFLRLILPFSFESIFSLISINTKTIPEEIIFAEIPKIESGIRLVDNSVNRVLPPAALEASVNPIQIWIFIGSIIWLTGLIILMAYTIFSSWRLSRKLRPAIHLHDNIYRMKGIGTAFVFGLINPKIYLADNLSQNEESYIIRHEETHIKRKDHLIKFTAFLITSIHWFNPLVWLAFYLMGQDMELSCDEAVIKKLGYGIKKDYSNSLLSLSIGRRIIGGSPLAFGENNTKGRIKNILNYKRPKSWVVVISIFLVIGLAIGLLSNPSKDKPKAFNEALTIEDLAWEYIEMEMNSYISPEWGNPRFIDKEITELEHLSTFDNILDSPIELWVLDYKLKPENPDEMVLAGGLDIVDGWLVDYGISGRPHLVLIRENGKLVNLGNANQIEFDLDTLASQEIAIRTMLEIKRILPGESYKSNHVLVKFPLSSGEMAQALLSQPVRQGDKGIWAVERWMDGNGNLYLVNPLADSDENIRIEDHYKRLQERLDKGENLFLDDPLAVASFFIHMNLGQVQIKDEDLIIINPASIDDFLISPAEDGSQGREGDLREKTYYFGPHKSSLEGQLITRLEYGSPNYGENPESDRKMHPFILLLDEPINVIAEDGDEFNSTISDLREIQLVLSNKEDIELAKEYEDSYVRLKGELFSALHGGHFTQVLIDVDEISQLGPLGYEKDENNIGQGETEKLGVSDLERFSAYVREDVPFEDLKNIYNISSDHSVQDDWYVISEDFFQIELLGYEDAKKVKFYLQRLESDQEPVLMTSNNNNSDGWIYRNHKIGEIIDKQKKPLSRGGFSYEPYFVIYGEVSLEDGSMINTPNLPIYNQ